jgi:hypothetical protein
LKPEYWSSYWGVYYNKASLIVALVKNNSQQCGGFIRKGQEQMMADYLWLELLERKVL